MIVSTVLWDQPGDPPANMESVICWRSYGRRDSMKSVPEYLEENAYAVRRKFLAYIHELGEFRVENKRLIDHLDMGDGFSFWWMTLLAEKSPFKSPRIYDCLRLLALEEILLEMRPAELTIVSSDSALVAATDSLCRGLHIRLYDKSSQRRKRRLSLRGIYQSFPFFLQGLLSLRHFIAHTALKKAKSRAWLQSSDAIFIASYFIHLDPTLGADGKFHSRQWEQLPALLRDIERPANWIHLFMLSSVVPSLEKGTRWLERFNSDQPSWSVHRFLQSYLTWRIVLSAFVSWLSLCAKSRRVRSVQSAFAVPDSVVQLWPMLRGDWRNSLSGPVALSNCFWIALFDAALAGIPKQRTGLYLCENQAWEKALLRAWRKYGHGEIIGVQHATVPFWHLYYFYDPRSFARTKCGELPVPDLLAVNGAAAKEALLQSGYPQKYVVETEALRYLHLAPAVFGQTSAERRGDMMQNRPRRILVLGDMIAEATDTLMSQLEVAAALLPPGYEFTLKAHPGYPVALEDYPSLAAIETHDSLGEIILNYDVAVAANSTSAAVDAYVAGLRVIIGVDGSRFNLSPLRGRLDVFFASSAEELTQAILSANRVTSTESGDRTDFFYLNDELPRWRSLLNQTGPLLDLR